MTFLQALILSIIEGITEFLPISSTGHMVIASHFFGINESAFVKSFEVIIQFGAIHSVIAIYYKKFFNDFNFYKKIITAFIPTAVIGFALKKIVDQWLESVTIVAWALIIGGIILILIDHLIEKKNHLTQKWIPKNEKTIQDMTLTESFKLGVIQCFALVPGVSRSGATIVGGLLMGFNKKEAAEFSFFLAVPTMAAATLYKSIKIIPTIKHDEISLLLIGSIVAFIVAFLAIKLFIELISKYGFSIFGYYRIVLGVIILILK